MTPFDTKTRNVVIIFTLVAVTAAVAYLRENPIKDELIEALQNASPDESTTITFEEGREEHIVNSMGYHVGIDGIIVDGKGEPVKSIKGRTVTVDSLAGFVHTPRRRDVPVADTIDELIALAGMEHEIVTFSH